LRYYLRHSQVVPRPYLLNRSCFIAEPDQKYSARRQSPGAYEKDQKFYGAAFLKKASPKTSL
ncbi:hypothetical protein, partial [Komagataeibacter xylinus]|uniref:hypothetical protein n=1 Tax=Komagataeibacter xylinus TaxID=28448 RepID=UPI0039EC2BB5